MKKTVAQVVLSCGLAASAMGCSGAPEESTGEDVASPLAAESTAQSAFSSASTQSCGGTPLAPVTRRSVSTDVAEYSFQVKVGPGAHDTIGIHRVVRERAPWVPIAAKKSLFMVHGDIWGFDTVFVGSAASTAVPKDQSPTIFFAKNDIDVWGIDLRWVAVPPGTTDFSFMKDWNIGTHVHDIGIGLGLARIVRGLTGSGFGQMTLLGWSRGAEMIYAYANAEARLPASLRNVKGIIPVDVAYKFSPADDALRQAACTRHTNEQASFNAGTFVNNTGAQVRGAGTGAKLAPDAPSPVVQGFTNRQAALFAGAMTFLIIPPPAFVPVYHFVGGQFTNNVPTGLTYTQPDYLFDFFKNASPFQSAGDILDGDAIECNDIDVPYDDHLADIKVPVLYMGAEGGFGHFGLYTTTLLGSTDVTTHVVNLTPAPARLLDFGHADLWLSDQAPTLVWQPIASWIASH